MPTIWICALDLVACALGFRDLVHGATHCALVAYDLWFDWPCVLGRTLSSSTPTDFVRVSLLLLQTARFEGEFHLSTASLLLAAIGWCCLASHAITLSNEVDLLDRWAV